MFSFSKIVKQGACEIKEFPPKQYTEALGDRGEVKEKSHLFWLWKYGRSNINK